MATTMETDSDVCVCCLSCNVTLWPLGEYSQMYKMLLGKETEHNTIDLKSFTCSDCQNMLNKIQIFQQKVLSSHEILLLRLTTDSQISDPKVDLKSEYDEYPQEDNIDDYYKVDDDCKDEPYIPNASIEFDVDVNVIENIKQEPVEDKDYKIVKEESVDVKVSDNSGKKYYRKRSKLNFKKTSGSGLIKKKYRYYTKVLCDEDIMKLNEEARLTWGYRHAKVKCRSCVIGFKKTENLQEHMQTRHAESIGPYICDICEVRTATKESLQVHVRQHYYNYVCTLCGQKCYKKWQMRMHFVMRHKKLFECPKCGIIFTYQREFSRHYKLMHERFICDHCGKLYNDRHWFENHILKMHTTFVCKPCNKIFKYYRNFDAHNKVKHTTAASESTYCVECDIQFPNIIQYRRHIQNSTRHFGRQRKKSASCPDCGKHYACRNNMMNHYRLEHLKVTNYQCQDCSRFFLNSYRLKEHRLVNHEKKGRAKNKICSYCGRGFSNNRILLYHVRTHTGERPHACEHCSATFAQPFALATHVKARHKDVLK